MQATVQVRDDVARALHRRAPATQEAGQLLRQLESMDLTLEPIHPHTDDPVLQTFFTVQVPDDGTADEVIARLRELAAIEAAYVKPPDALP
jgi:hypothetical protein